MINPEEDGVKHINIYSKGKTELGRLLSNFTYSPIFTEDGNFNSIEGYWYWLSCKDDRLRELSGFKAKQLGRELRGDDWNTSPEFVSKIKRALIVKFGTYNGLLKDFVYSNLPFEHYYVYGNKIIQVKDGRWLIEFLTNLRELLNDR